MSTAYIIISIVVLGFSVMLHEVCHAWSAYKMGDPTGHQDGRISLNPFRHIDPVLTILMPIILLIATNGKFAFGGAKPVRINPLNFRNPSFDMMVTAAAGPACNLGLVVAGILLLCMLTSVSPELVQPGSYNAIFFGYLILINLMLGIFNLIPIPPLDGSRILRHFLTSSGRNFMDSIEPFGLLILMVVIFVTRIIDFIIVVFTNIVNYVLFVILGPGYNIFNLLGFT